MDRVGGGFMNRMNRCYVVLSALFSLEQYLSGPAET